MFPSLNLYAAVTPSGDPTLKPGLDPASVTPGTLGFLATLFIVVVVIFLIRDMVKRIRRVRYAAEVEEVRVQRASLDGGDFPRTEGPGAVDGSAGAGGAGPEQISSQQERPHATEVPRPGGAHGPDNR